MNEDDEDCEEECADPDDREECLECLTGNCVVHPVANVLAVWKRLTANCGGPGSGVPGPCPDHDKHKTAHAHAAAAAQRLQRAIVAYHESPSPASQKAMKAAHNDYMSRIKEAVKIKPGQTNAPETEKGKDKNAAKSAQKAAPSPTSEKTNGKPDKAAAAKIAASDKAHGGDFVGHVVSQYLAHHGYRDVTGREVYKPNDRGDSGMAARLASGKPVGHPEGPRPGDPALMQHAKNDVLERLQNPSKADAAWLKEKLPQFAQGHAATEEGRGVTKPEEFAHMAKGRKPFGLTGNENPTGINQYTKGAQAAHDLSKAALRVSKNPAISGANRLVASGGRGFHHNMALAKSALALDAAQTHERTGTGNSKQSAKNNHELAASHHASAVNFHDAQRSIAEGKGDSKGAMRHALAATAHSLAKNAHQKAARQITGNTMKKPNSIQRAWAVIAAALGITGNTDQHPSTGKFITPTHAAAISGSKGGHDQPHTATHFEDPSEELREDDASSQLVGPDNTAEWGDGRRVSPLKRGKASDNVDGDRADDNSPENVDADDDVYMGKKQSTNRINAGSAGNDRRGRPPTVDELMTSNAESYEDKRSELQSQLADRLENDGEDDGHGDSVISGGGAWISDMFDDHIVYQCKGKWYVLPYVMKGGETKLSSDDPVEVKRRTEYEPVGNADDPDEDDDEDDSELEDDDSDSNDDDSETEDQDDESTNNAAACNCSASGQRPAINRTTGVCANCGGMAANDEAEDDAEPTGNDDEEVDSGDVSVGGGATMNANPEGRNQYTGAHAAADLNALRDAAVHPDVSREHVKAIVAGIGAKIKGRDVKGLGAQLGKDGLGTYGAKTKKELLDKAETEITKAKGMYGRSLHGGLGLKAGSDGTLAKMVRDKAEASPRVQAAMPRVKELIAEHYKSTANARLAYNARWPAAKRGALPTEDFAGPHQSFPIKTQQDVESAATLAGHADDPDAVKAKVKKIASRKGLSLPESWKEQTTENAMPFPPQAVPPQDPHEASMQAAQATQATKHAPAFGPVHQAVAASAAGKPKQAARFHAQAADVHDDAAQAAAANPAPPQPGEPTADDHLQSAMLNRKAQAMHLANNAAKKKCPECGMAMKDGVCPDCGANDDVTDNENSGPYSPAQFAMMDKKNAGEETAAAKGATAKAEKSGKSSHHAAAHEAHKEAYGHHKEEGNDELAAAHKGMMKYHAKAAKSATTNSNEVLMTNAKLKKLIANCTCDETKRSLKAALASNVESVSGDPEEDDGPSGGTGKKGKDADYEDDDDDLAEDAMSSAKKPAPKQGSNSPIGNSRDRAAVKKWLDDTNAPPAVREATLNSWKQADAKKADIARKLVANVADPERKKALFNKLVRLTEPELQERLELLPTSQTENTYVGGPDAPYYDQPQLSLYGGAQTEQPVANADATAAPAIGAANFPTFNWGEAMVEQAKLPPALVRSAM